MENRQKVILDCDNTMGLWGCDIDDGLALLYLLGEPDIDLLGVTLTHGNAGLKHVARATARMLHKIGRSGLPVRLGAARPDHHQRTEGAEFILQAARQYPGEITLVATGPLTNLAAALKMEPGLSERLKAVHVMGGLTAPLTVGKRQCRELNLSADPAAAELVFSHQVPLILFPAQGCLSSRIGWREIAALSGTNWYLRFQLIRWVLCFGLKYGCRHIHPWDLLPAIAVLNPDQFSLRRAGFDGRESNLARGEISLSPEGPLLVAEDIRKPDLLFATARAAWRRSLPTHWMRHPPPFGHPQIT